nr:sugar ABC transporter ATP-binding protein [Kosmotoga sp. DU53]
MDLDPEELVGRLSVADRQLVAICRAMIADAKLVIMDEPTASLSKKEVENLFKVIKDLQSKGVSTLFVSHKLNEIMEIAERVTVLRDGKKVGVYQAEELDNEKLTYLMTGKKFSYSKLTKDFTNSDDVLLEIRHLSKKNNYKDINLTLHKGEIIGITGLLGSGRTELALSLFGMNEPDEGEILIEGKSVNLKSHEEAIKHGIGYVPEDRLSQGLVMDQSVGKNIIITILNRLLGKWNLLDRNKQDWETKKWVDKLSIKIPSIEAPVRTLSGGNQQRVVLAKWIATNPKILILDSPTVGVDIAAKDSIYEIVRRLASEGIGIIMISDEIEEVLYHSHIVYVMKAGRIIGKYRSDRITERELYEKANAKD